MRMGCLPLLLRKKFWPRPHPLSRGLKTLPKMTKTGITSKIFVRLTQIRYQLIGFVVVPLLLRKKFWPRPHPHSRGLKTRPKLTKTGITSKIFVRLTQIWYQLIAIVVGCASFAEKEILTPTTPSQQGIKNTPKNN